MTKLMIATAAEMIRSNGEKEKCAKQKLFYNTNHHTTPHHQMSQAKGRTGPAGLHGPYLADHTPTTHNTRRFLLNQWGTATTETKSPHSHMNNSIHKEWRWEDGEPAYPHHLRLGGKGLGLGLELGVMG